MLRRNFLVAAVASVVGLLFGRSRTVADLVEVDTTTMHNEEFRTSSLVERTDIEGTEHTSHTCKRIDVVHDGPGPAREGYKTLVLIDGESLAAQGLLEREIEVFTRSQEKQTVVVTYLRRSDKVNVRIVFTCDDLYVTCAALSIRPHPKRSPSQILLNGFEPYVSELHVLFKEGEAPWIDLKVLPKGEIDYFTDEHAALIKKAQDAFNEYEAANASD